jgi:hypothetical protein
MKFQELCFSRCGASAKQSFEEMRSQAELGNEVLLTAARIFSAHAGRGLLTVRGVLLRFACYDVRWWSVTSAEVPTNRELRCDSGMAPPL